MTKEIQDTAHWQKPTAEELQLLWDAEQAARDPLQVAYDAEADKRGWVLYTKNQLVVAMRNAIEVDRMGVDMNLAEVRRWLAAYDTVRQEHVAAIAAVEQAKQASQ